MEGQKNDLLQVLTDMRNGAVAIDISAKFDEMIKAVLETGGKGELTITLKAERRSPAPGRLSPIRSTSPSSTERQGRKEADSE